MKIRVAMVAVACLFSLLYGISFAPFSCFAQEMVTIENYMGQNNFQRNPGAAQFVFLRCASLFLLVGGHLQDTPDLKEMGKKYSEAGNSFLAASAQASKPFNQQFAVDQLDRMMEGYKERWLRAKALSGNFSDDPIIRSDMLSCAALSKIGARSREGGATNASVYARHFRRGDVA